MLDPNVHATLNGSLCAEFHASGLVDTRSSIERLYQHEDPSPAVEVSGDSGSVISGISESVIGLSHLSALLDVMKVGEVILRRDSTPWPAASFVRQGRNIQVTFLPTT